MAIEGSTAAGPIGGSDIRSALLPPPGLYGGLIALRGTLSGLVDGSGREIAALDAAHVTASIVGPFLFYIPDIEVVGGSIALAGIIPYGSECGRLFVSTPRRCAVGFGDPYVEVAWSRYFGTPRPSRYPGAFPIPEGLAVSLAFGVVFPTGQYNAQQVNFQGVGIGNNIYDFAPSIALTYTTPAFLAEGTEFSAKLYWNNYLTNPSTQYAAGSLINIDFAVTERIGRVQAGLAGVYAVQTADDRQFGIKVPPDGRRMELLLLGPVINYDMPEHGAAIKLKALLTAHAENAAITQTFVVGLVKKF